MNRSEKPVKFHRVIRETDTSYIVLTDTIYDNFYMTVFSKSDFQGLLDYHAECFAGVTDQSLKKAGYCKKEREQMLRDASREPTLDEFFDRLSVNEYFYYLGHYDSEPTGAEINSYAELCYSVICKKE